MAISKYLSYVSGKIKQLATKDASAGAGDAGVIPSLNAAGVLDSTIINSTESSSPNKVVRLNASGKLDLTLFPTGYGDDAEAFVAGEDLSAGNFVYIVDDGGTAKAFKSDASDSTKYADGFVLSSALADASIVVYFEGINTSLTGLSVGATHFLSETAGLSTATPPTTTGSIVQRLGRAIGVAKLSFEPSQPIEL